MIKNNILFRLGKIEIGRISSVFILFAILFGGSESQAQVTGANGPISWISFMAVYTNLNGAKGNSAFNDLWSVSDLKTTVLPSDFNHKLQLFPNYNAYAFADTNYWRNNGGAGPLGNKWMEANTIATNSLRKLDTTQPIVFAGNFPFFRMGINPIPSS
jgi:hypothetical protein